MTRYSILGAALLLAVPAAAQDPLAPAPEPSAAESAPDLIGSRSNPEEFDLAKRKVVDCEGEKFVFAWGAGARPTKVTLCSKKNATPDEIVVMLEDAAAKLESTASVAEDRRVAIVQQIRAKVAEIRKTAAAPEPPAATAEAPANSSVPAAAAPPSALARQPALASPVVRSPMPVAARSVIPPRPRLSFECYTPGELGSGGPCTILARDTRLTVKAAEALAGGAARLRFVRNGETRAEVALQQLRKGQSTRMILPRELCAGVVETEAKIEVISGGRAVDTIGPYLLRCL